MSVRFFLLSLSPSHFYGYFSFFWLFSQICCRFTSVGQQFARNIRKNKFTWRLRFYLYLNALYSRFSGIVNPRYYHDLTLNSPLLASESDYLFPTLSVWKFDELLLHSRNFKIELFQFRYDLNTNTMKFELKPRGFECHFLSFSMKYTQRHRQKNTQRLDDICSFLYSFILFPLKSLSYYTLQDGGLKTTWKFVCIGNINKV